VIYMNRGIFWEIVALVLTIAVIGTVSLPLLDNYVMPEKREPNTILIRAYIQESGGFDPGVIRVKKGETVKLVVEGMDVVHGFKSEALGIDLGPIEPGEKKVVEFTPKEEGVYMFECTVVCSPIHHYMRGIIIVEGE